MTLHVAVGPSTKSKSSVLVLGDDFVDDSIHAAVAKHEAITLASVKIFATADEKPPGSTLNLEHLGAITASEVAPIGLFLVLTCTDDVAHGRRYPKEFNTEGRRPLPLCTECHDKKTKPVLVGKVNLVDAGAEQAEAYRTSGAISSNQ